MIAALDMYNWPESTEAFRMFWGAVRDALLRRGIDAPIGLSPLDENLHDIAASGDLLLGQICGITYARANAEMPRFSALGAFICDDTALAPGQYCSVLVAPKGRAPDLDDPSSLRAAINGYGSLSGWIMLAQYVSGQAQASPFKDIVLSGGHRQSAEMVAAGGADIAALDIICWHMFTRFSPDMAAQLDVVGRTPPRPGLPLVTSSHHGPAMMDALKSALDDAFVAPEIAAAMSGLGINGLAPNSEDDYRSLLQL